MRDLQTLIYCSFFPGHRKSIDKKLAKYFGHPGALDLQTVLTVFNYSDSDAAHLCNPKFDKTVVQKWKNGKKKIPVIYFAVLVFCSQKKELVNWLTTVGGFRWWEKNIIIQKKGGERKIYIA